MIIGASMDARTATTPYTAAATASASGTAGTAVNDDTYLSGAQIGTIKNVYINANGYGILNGVVSSPNTALLPTIGEIGEGTEIYAHCTTAAYHAIANASYAEISSITGGVFTVTKATTNAYLNGYDSAEHATLISGGDFLGMSATRDNAIYKPDNTNRQTYPDGYSLSSDTRSVTLYNGTSTGTTATGYYYIAAQTYTVTWKNEDGTVLETDTGVASGTTPTYDGVTPTKAADAQYTYTFSAWSPAIEAVTGDVTYTATYTQTLRTYTITWKQDDGTTIDTTTVAYGATPTHATPTKTAPGYTYTFTGWTPAISSVTGDATYEATYSSTAVSAVAPTITTQPAGLSLTYGFTTGNTLTAQATADSGTAYTLSYQWYSNTSATNSGGTLISGATSASYAVPTGTAAGTYYYYCVVTATRSDNGQTASTASNAATVTVANAYNFTITWGSLDYTYTEPSYSYTWDGANMRYTAAQTDAGGWSLSSGAADAGSVTVTNNSSALAVAIAEMNFTKDAGITAWGPGLTYYTNAGRTAAASFPMTVHAGAAQSIYMLPTGTPDGSWDGSKTLGTVQIRITAA